MISIVAQCCWDGTGDLDRQTRRRIASALPGQPISSEVAGTGYCSAGCGWHVPRSPLDHWAGVAKDEENGLLVSGYLRRAGTRAAEHCSRDAILAVARDFRRHGPRVFRECLDEFSLVIWDERERRIIAARDRSGPSALFYRTESRGLALSTDIEQLLDRNALRPSLNPDTVLDFLEDQYRDAGATFFEGIRRIPPGFCLCADRSTLRIERYWEPIREHISIGHPEALERFRDLMSRAVVNRTDRDSNSVFEVSGGFDSTTVAAFSVRVQPELPSRLLVSKTYPDHKSCDESEFLDAFEKFFGVSLHRVPVSRPSHDSSALLFSSPPPYVSSLWEPYNREIVKLGARTLMSGHGGDNLFTEAAVLGDMLTSGRFAELASEFVARPKYGPQRRSYYARCALAGIGPLALWKRRIGRVRSFAQSSLPPAWVGDALRSCWKQKRRNNGRGNESFVFSSQIQRKTFSSMVDSDYCWRLEHIRANWRALGVELSTPFFDSKLVDFMLELPFYHRIPKGRSKRFLHDAMEGFLPKAILQRSQRTYFDSVVYDAMWAELRASEEKQNSTRWMVEQYVPRRLFQRERAAVLDEGFSERTRIAGPRLYRAWLLNRWIQVFS